MPRLAARSPQSNADPVADATLLAEPNPPCPVCDAPLGGPAFDRFRVCDACGYHARRSARETIAELVDHGSFREMDARLASFDPLGFIDDLPYQERLEATRRRTGEADAAVTGAATIGDRPAILAVLDFNFLGGSMGVVVGEKIARAAERAGHERKPLVTIVASGGARMQEGMLSLLQMAKTAAAIKRLRDRGVPYISMLTNPTTGGVFASFANLGDIIMAEPGALIGFAGPRVAEQAIGHKLPPGTHQAESLLQHGMIDAIVDRRALRDHLGALLTVFAAPRTGFRRAPAKPVARTTAAPDVWSIVGAARALDRPTSQDYIDRMLETFIELHGDRATGDDPAILAGLGLLHGRAVLIVAIERGHDPERTAHRGGRARPAGYRKAQRVMTLAGRLQIPVISLIDTPGAYPGPESETGGLAGELASSMALMSDLPTVTVAAVIGEGGSGGALALAVTDRVLMQAGAIYSVIPPEGAATILYKDATRAAELSEQLKITAPELLRLRLVDAIVAEPKGGAAADPDEAARLLQQALETALADLTRHKTRRLLRDRWERYQAVGRQQARQLSRRRMPRRPIERAAIPKRTEQGRPRRIWAPWRRRSTEQPPAMLPSASPGEDSNAVASQVAEPA